MQELLKNTEGNSANNTHLPLSISEIKKTKTVRMNKNNYWLLKLLYGDAAADKTAKFQVPHNVKCGML